MQMMNCTAFVTGAAQGLGKAFSEALLHRGARVCLTDVQVNKGQQVESVLQKKYGQDKVFFLPCDVSSEENLKSSFQKAVSKFGHVNLMVNNAGIVDESNLKSVVNINLVGVIQGSLLAIEHMRKDKGGKGGKIINIASMAGLTGVYFSPFYSATKFGVVGFHLSWAGNPHNEKLGLQFGCLCPAFAATPIIEMNENQMLYFEEGKKLIEQLGVIKVETVVDGFLQLAESENCNGDLIKISVKDGIQHARKGQVVKTSRL
ncbi:15-hydroxyprostaglandin dehydrogenase [NAD(+)]-like [Physella acuta]|uniref:15-hydroxyprostaglandin dehydrogenase [NAD(+)]-like n=1 Tax=Physella acuta TaxID=109671 RepID=UPI0027DCEE6F|nr:15-hydroxyprostaglandin dehydrogenase [NAD(+)]-like [Physella acuta]